MNKEIQSIIVNLERVNTGQPWFGRSVYELLDEIDPAIVYKKPNKQHSLADLLYHMITWADFTLQRIKGDKEKDMAAFEELDWREINPKTHTWEKGLAEFKEIHKNIVELLNQKDDKFLKEMVDYRKYNFRFLLNGLIQHNIYHIGQVAYVKKLLE
ncbi:MAG TPA: DinB family protein [Chitinophagaceae bacterium]|nr:DinB family protein [Chitinophagaceae bacterium]